MKKPVFITGTGTGIGKTYVTASLARNSGGGLFAVKPVLSGFLETEETDAHILMHANKRRATLEEISPWRFAAPLSPDSAAAREGREIDFNALVEWCRQQILHTEEDVLIEGVGGIMVPLTARHTVLDWIAALNIPVLLVAGSYLGTISHTLTSLAVLKSRKITVQGVVISESPQSPMPLAETAATIERFSGIKPQLLARGGELMPQH